MDDSTRRERPDRSKEVPISLDQSIPEVEAQFSVLTKQWMDHLVQIVTFLHRLELGSGTYWDTLRGKMLSMKTASWSELRDNRLVVELPHLFSRKEGAMGGVHGGNKMVDHLDIDSALEHSVLHCLRNNEQLVAEDAYSLFTQKNRTAGRMISPRIVRAIHGMSCGKNVKPGPVSIKKLKKVAAYLHNNHRQRVLLQCVKIVRQENVSSGVGYSIAIRAFDYVQNSRPNQMVVTGVDRITNLIDVLPIGGTAMKSIDGTLSSKFWDKRGGATEAVHTNDNLMADDNQTVLIAHPSVENFSIEHEGERYWFKKINHPFSPEQQRRMVEQINQIEVSPGLGGKKMAWVAVVADTSVTDGCDAFFCVGDRNLYVANQNMDPLTRKLFSYTNWMMVMMMDTVMSMKDCVFEESKEPNTVRLKNTLVYNCCHIVVGSVEKSVYHRHNDWDDVVSTPTPTSSVPIGKDTYLADRNNMTVVTMIVTNDERTDSVHIIYSKDGKDVTSVPLGCTPIDGVQLFYHVQGPGLQRKGWQHRVEFDRTLSQANTYRVIFTFRQVRSSNTVSKEEVFNAVNRTLNLPSGSGMAEWKEQKHVCEHYPLVNALNGVRDTDKTLKRKYTGDNSDENRTCGSCESSANLPDEETSEEEEDLMLPQEKAGLLQLAKEHRPQKDTYLTLPRIVFAHLNLYRPPKSVGMSNGSHVQFHMRCSMAKKHLLMGEHVGVVVNKGGVRCTEYAFHTLKRTDRSTGKTTRHFPERGKQYPLQQVSAAANVSQCSRVHQILDGTQRASHTKIVIISECYKNNAANLLKYMESLTSRENQSTQRFSLWGHYENGSPVEIFLSGGTPTRSGMYMPQAKKCRKDAPTMSIPDGQNLETSVNIALKELWDNQNVIALYVREQCFFEKISSVFFGISQYINQGTYKLVDPAIETATFVDYFRVAQYSEHLEDERSFATSFGHYPKGVREMCRFRCGKHGKLSLQPLFTDDEWVVLRRGEDTLVDFLVEEENENVIYSSGYSAYLPQQGISDLDAYGREYIEDTYMDERKLNSKVGACLNSRNDVGTDDGSNESMSDENSELYDSGADTKKPSSEEVENTNWCSVRHLSSLLISKFGRGSINDRKENGTKGARMIVPKAQTGDRDKDGFVTVNSTGIVNIIALNLLSGSLRYEGRSILQVGEGKVFATPLMDTLSARRLPTIMRVHPTRMAWPCLDANFLYLRHSCISSGLSMCVGSRFKRNEHEAVPINLYCDTLFRSIMMVIYGRSSIYRSWSIWSKARYGMPGLMDKDSFTRYIELVVRGRKSSRLSSLMVDARMLSSIPRGCLFFDSFLTFMDSLSFEISSCRTVLEGCFESCSYNSTFCNVAGILERSTTDINDASVHWLTQKVLLYLRNMIEEPALSTNVGNTVIGKGSRNGCNFLTDEIWAGGNEESHQERPNGLQHCLQGLISTYPSPCDHENETTTKYMLEANEKKRFEALFTNILNAIETNSECLLTSRDTRGNPYLDCLGLDIKWIDTDKWTFCHKLNGKILDGGDIEHVLCDCINASINHTLPHYAYARFPASDDSGCHPLLLPMNKSLADSRSDKANSSVSNPFWDVDGLFRSVVSGYEQCWKTSDHLFIPKVLRLPGGENRHRMRTTTDY